MLIDSGLRLFCLWRVKRSRRSEIYLARSYALVVRIPCAPARAALTLAIPNVPLEISLAKIK